MLATLLAFCNNDNNKFVFIFSLYFLHWGNKIAKYKCTFIKNVSLKKNIFGNFLKGGIWIYSYIIIYNIKCIRHGGYKIYEFEIDNLCNTDQIVKLI